jgi:hypothetical protein
LRCCGPYQNVSRETFLSDQSRKPYKDSGAFFTLVRTIDFLVQLKLGGASTNYFRFPHLRASRCNIISYKQRMAGVFLSGQMVEVPFIPCGNGSNGKTTELETYQAVLGDYGHATDASLLLARKETCGPTPEIVLQACSFHK